MMVSTNNITKAIRSALDRSRSRRTMVRGGHRSPMQKPYFIVSIEEQTIPAEQLPGGTEVARRITSQRVAMTTNLLYSRAQLIHGKSSILWRYPWNLLRRLFRIRTPQRHTRGEIRVGGDRLPKELRLAHNLHRSPDVRLSSCLIPTNFHSVVSQNHVEEENRRGSRRGGQSRD